MSALVAIVVALMPQVGQIISAVVSLRRQYPAMTAEQIQALVAEITKQADGAFDGVLAQIAADQAAHPVPK